MGYFWLLEPIYRHLLCLVKNNVFSHYIGCFESHKNILGVKSELFEKCRAALCDMVKNRKKKYRYFFFLKALEKSVLYVLFTNRYLVWSKSLQKFSQNFFWVRSVIFDHGEKTPCSPPIFLESQFHSKYRKASRLILSWKYFHVRKNCYKSVKTLRSPQKRQKKSFSQIEIGKKINKKT